MEELAKRRFALFALLVGVVAFAVTFIIGEGIIKATGIPFSSAFVTALPNLIAITFVALAFKRYGSVSLAYIPFALLSIPTNIAGPPGLWWKVIVVLLSTIVYETIIWFFSYKERGVFIGLPIFTLMIFGTRIVIADALNLPELPALLAYTPILFVSFVTLGTLGVWIGIVLYNKCCEGKMHRWLHGLENKRGARKV